MTKTRVKELGIGTLCALLSAGLSISGLLLVFAFTPLWWLRYRVGVRPAVAAAIGSGLLVAAWFVAGYLSGQTSAGEVGNFVFLISSTAGIYAISTFWLGNRIPGVTRQLVIASLIAAVAGAFPIIAFSPDIVAGLRLAMGPFYDSLGLPAPDAKTVNAFVDFFRIGAPVTILGIAGVNRQFARSLFYRETEALPALARFQLPTRMVWLFSLSILGLLLTQLVAIPQALRTGIYVCLGLVTFLYLLQGVGILQHLFVRRTWSGPARVLPIAVLLGFVIHPLVGCICYGLLVLFGVSETWFAYRLESPKNKET